MGPLEGLKVVEFAGLGPTPFCAMLLADLGAEVIRIDRTDGGKLLDLDPTREILNRGRKSVALNLKHSAAVEVALRLVAQSDVLIEGFRPGVMERMGLGPELCLQRNSHLVYGRMTGWGQTGPMSQAAGHDINYIALAGVLALLGRPGKPPIAPLNLVGDMGGGGLLLAFGLVCALFEAQRSGQGQVVDASMVEGAALQLSGIMMLRANAQWSDVRGSNLMDGGAHFYNVYETADGEHLAVGAIEPAFYAAFCDGAGLDPGRFGAQWDVGQWPALRAEVAEVIKTKTSAEWVEIFDGVDACVTPVLSLDDAADHPQNASRQVYLSAQGIMQPAPAPRFSRTPAHIDIPPPRPGEHTSEVLSAFGVSDREIATLLEQGAAALAGM